MRIERHGPTLQLSGDFDVRSTFQVRAAINELLAAYADDLAATLVIDLSEVESADVTALKVLAAATRRASGGGQHLSLLGCRPAVRRLLHLSHLFRLVEVQPVSASG